MQSRKKKVHAEIQLIFHYEKQGNEIPRPRVICSNKYACFLCNLFIEAYGHFYVPGSHGVLYAQWRMPTIAELDLPQRSASEGLQCLDRFNEALETKIRTCITQPELLLPDASESIIFDPPSQTASSISVQATNNSATRTGVHVNHALDDLHMSVQPISLSAQGFTFATHRLRTCETVMEDQRTVSLIPTPPSRATTLSAHAPMSGKSSRVSSISIIPAGPESNGPCTQSLDSSSLQSSSRSSGEQLQTLTRGRALTLVLTSGAYLRIHTPRIHLTIDHKTLGHLTSSKSLDLDRHLTVSVVLLHAHQKGLHISHENTADLSLPWTQKVMPPGILFGEGLVLRKEHEVVIVRAVNEIKSVS